MNRRIFIIIVLLVWITLSSTRTRQAYQKIKKACSECHHRSVSCHIENKINIDRLYIVGAGSFHKSLLNAPPDLNAL